MAISRSLTRDYLSAKLVLRPGGLLPSCPLSAQDEQTLCNISLLIWRFAAASAAQGVSLN